MWNQNSIHVDDVTCDMCQVIFVCPYGAHNYSIQNGCLQKRKSGKEIKHLNFQTTKPKFPLLLLHVWK